jgi:hypothetical protein
MARGWTDEHAAYEATGTNRRTLEPAVCAIS